MTKATAGERFAAKYLGITIDDLRGEPETDDQRERQRIVKSLDRLLARERAKVAKDVLAMADDILVDMPNVSAKAYSDTVKAEVRAKYGAKGKR